MFRIPQLQQAVVQVMLVGDDEVVVAQLFDQLLEDTGAVCFDVAGTDGERLRTLRYTTDREADGLQVAVNLSSVASARLQFDEAPISTGARPARELAVMGVDACIQVGRARATPELPSETPVLPCDEPHLESLYTAIARAIETVEFGDETAGDDDGADDTADDADLPESSQTGQDHALGPDELAARAATGAERFRAMVAQVDGIQLEYDGESVEKLSELISRQRETWKSQMNEQQLFRFSELMGCYYGECVRRIFTGTWSFFSNQPAVQVRTRRKSSFWQRLKGRGDEVHWALPFANVQNHLDRGDEKSVSLVFGGFRSLVDGEAS